jgi:hypothetical protein
MLPGANKRFQGADAPRDLACPNRLSVAREREFSKISTTCCAKGKSRKSCAKMTRKDRHKQHFFDKVVSLLCGL